jgi:hypothetical protein
MKHGADMSNLRRLTFNPPLAEAEFAGLCAANPGLQIDREPSGVIIVRAKRKRSEEHRDWVLSGIDMRHKKRPSAGTEVPHFAEDTETLQALEALEGRLFRERETSEGAHARALNIAIRALISSRDVLESLMTYEQGMPQKVTGRDMDPYDQRREYLNDSYQTVDQCPARRNVAQSVVVSAGRLSPQTAPDVKTGNATENPQSARNRRHTKTAVSTSKERRPK